MSAGIEFEIFMDGVKDFIFKRKNNMDQINSSMRKEIENSKIDLEKLQNMSSSNIEEYKSKNISTITEYINYFLSKNELEEVKKYRDLLKKVEKTTKFSEILEIYDEDEDGKIISPKGENDLVIEIEKDNLKLDIPGKGRSCVSTLMEFERITQNELKKNKTEWHTLEKEKKLKKNIVKAREKLNFNQIYDRKLMEKEK